MQNDEKPEEKPDGMQMIREEDGLTLPGMGVTIFVASGPIETVEEDDDDTYPEGTATLEEVMKELHAFHNWPYPPKDE